MLSLAGKVFSWDSFFVSSLTLFATLLASFIFTDIRLAEIIKYWIVNFTFSLLIEEGIAQALALIFPDLRQANENAVTFITILEILLLLCLSGLSIFQSPTPLVLSGKTATILFVSFGNISIFLSFMNYMITKFPKGQPQTAGKLFLTFAALGCLTASIMLLYTFRQRQHFQKQADIENEYNKQQQEYFHMLLEKEQETKKFRHDITNHMLCIQNMAKEKKIEEIQQYLEDILHVLNQISKKDYSVGNETIDVLLNHYLAPIRERCHIEVEGTFGKATHISRMELCTIFSNILKNAVEAVAKIPLEDSPKKRIYIYASHGEKSMKLTVQNTYTGKIEIYNNMIITQKKDKNSHGFGMENTQAAIKRCGGIFVYQIEPPFVSPANISIPQHSGLQATETFNHPHAKDTCTENALFSVEVILPIQLSGKK